jgi:hypothetical protein
MSVKNKHELAPEAGLEPAQGIPAVRRGYLV